MIVRQTARRLPARTRSAFTLLEVLVVVAILVILASVSTFATVSYLERAKRSEANLKMQKVETAAKAFYTQYSYWPSSPQDLVQMGPDGTAPFLEGGASAISDPWGAPFTLAEEQDSTGSIRVRIYSSGSGNQMAWPLR
ncbi:prepilin-type N-terminal cleavage/methylation domain-containing protein [Fimbriiglobus ruber]|uniref:Type II secretion system protein GspG C-terminal domain-containing protein n=1 Tax=Fimbriiglobus ruber TaxID=1908690 RepID=A0A225E1K6_9BACT|nr:prepilin-type N-terminal cleavage/methylation domain-containing protein [Fimbriiglobus ruber]OWK45664.1 hypothetical protein FRUB_01995 [Fimbriiglobus ruber]